MAQFTLTINDPKDVSLIKKLLAKFDAVPLKKKACNHKTGLNEALEDVALNEDCQNPRSYETS